MEIITFESDMAFSFQFNFQKGQLATLKCSFKYFHLICNEHCMYDLLNIAKLM